LWGRTAVRPYITEGQRIFNGVTIFSDPEQATFFARAVEQMEQVA